MKRVTVMHSFAGMLVVLLLSLLLRGMCLYVRVMGLRLLTHSDCLPRKPTSPAHLYSARNCLAYTPHPCPPSDEAHTLAMFWALLAAAA